LTAVAKELAVYGDPVDSKVCLALLFFWIIKLEPDSFYLMRVKASLVHHYSYSFFFLLMVHIYVSWLQAGQGAKLLNILAKYCEGKC